MADNDGVYWGPMGKEWRLKDFVEHQDREVTRTREATEAAARAVAQQGEELVASLRQMANAEEQQANKLRLTPDVLFQLSEVRPEVNEAIAEVVHKLDSSALVGAADDATLTTLNKAAQLMRGYFKALFSLDSSYLQDFSQKKLLKEMQEEVRSAIKRWNQVVPSNRHVRDLFIPEVVRGRYPVARQFTKDQLQDCIRRIAARDDAVEQHNTSVKEWEQAIGRNDNAFTTAIGISLVGAVVVALIGAVAELLPLGVLAGVLGLGGIIVVPVFFVAANAPLKRKIEAAKASCKTVDEELSEIYPLLDVDGVNRVQKEMTWRGDAWVLEDSGKAAVFQEIEQALRIPVPT
jgi:hypothetical protein